METQTILGGRGFLLPAPPAAAEGRRPPVPRGRGREGRAALSHSLPRLLCMAKGRTPRARHIRGRSSRCSRLRPLDEVLPALTPYEPLDSEEEEDLRLFFPPRSSSPPPSSRRRAFLRSFFSFLRS